MNLLFTKKHGMKWEARAAELLIVTAVVYLTKRYYSSATAEDLRWILLAVAQTTTVLSGIEFTWEQTMGYTSQDHLLVIAPACAGINFFIAAWLTLLLTTANAKKASARWLRAVVLMVPALAATIVINAHRVYFILRDGGSHRTTGILCFCLGLFVVAGASHAIAHHKLPSQRTLVGCSSVYFLVALVLPALNGAGHNSNFADHAVAVLRLGTLVLVITAVALALVKLAWRRGSPMHA